ncbi:hypothetical protein ACFC09_37860 [Streptomyces sp. NPDC056161]|uniref:hypothetical protein n=1 Tax=Streptomyces sp. NPDC056161 TaxID=3345732 RepID=UPI0035D99758
MTCRRTLLAAGELSAWRAGLALLWLVFISTANTLELTVGAGAAAWAGLRCMPREGR